MVSQRHHSDVVPRSSLSAPSSRSTVAHGPAATAIAVRDLVRTYRRRAGWFRSHDTVEAVRGITLAVPRGSIFGILGPNGAGKTTTIKMLATLLVPTSGVAEVDGFDVTRHEVDVRRRLGVLFGGDKGLYNQLSARENLRYFGHLYGMPTDLIAERSDELLAQVGLSDRAAERVESYSRGMKQRLHIAKTLIHRPPVVTLDEPTIGLDPAAALEVRALIAGLAPEHTVMLSTHDMHEADVLCETVAIIDRGKIVAEGTPTALKAAAPVDRHVLISLSEGPRGEVPRLSSELSGLPGVIDARVEAGSEGSEVVVRCSDSSVALDHALAVLRGDGSQVRSIDVREPTLEDAFLGATGRVFEPEEIEDIPA
jgi:ABC-2 type transport system ATP-binding protein